MIRKIFWLLLFAAIPALAFQANTPTPEYMPTCTSPQGLVPVKTAVGSSYGSREGVVWNGKEFAVAWIGTGSKLSWMRYFADGTPDGAESNPTSLTSFGPEVCMVWTGSNYAVAWIAEAGTDAYEQVYFARLNPDGTLIGNPVKVSFVGLTETVNCEHPSLAWDGSGYVVAWDDDRYSSSSGNAAFDTFLLSDGSTTAYTDSFIGNGGDPSIVYNTAAQAYTVAWQSALSGTGIYLNVAAENTTGTTYGTTTYDTGSGNSTEPCLVDTGNGAGLAWTDTRDGNDEIYFDELVEEYYFYSAIGGPINLSNDTVTSNHPRVVWTGAEFGVFWQSLGNTSKIKFQRVSVDGVPQGSSYAEMDGGQGFENPNAAFGHYGYMSTAKSYYSGNTHYLQPWGCNYPYTPACPSGVMAYGVSTTTATVAWLPVDGNGTDIAYYLIYRDDAPIAKTADTYYTDTGLVSGTTYKYTVHAVNAADNESMGCSSSTTTSSVYVKPTAAVLLKVNKSSPDALLSWTDTSNMSSYNVYRGTNPQVMQKLGNTSTQTYDDANALTNSNVYFYTVDDPGQ